MVLEDGITHRDSNEPAPKQSAQAVNPGYPIRFRIPLNGFLNEPGTAIVMYKIEGQAILDIGEPHQERGIQLMSIDYIVEGSIREYNSTGVGWKISGSGRSKVLSGSGCTILRPKFPLRQGTSLFLRLCFSIRSDSVGLAEMRLERHISRTKTDEDAKTKF